MFRLLRVKPPNGWGAVAWELAIVTAGVLIALAVQQWAEERSWRQRAEVAKASLRQELGEHYRWAVEWRVVEPCLLAQVAKLQDRVLASGERLTVSPILGESGFTSYVLRMPSKDYNRSAFDSVIADGVASRLDQDFRARLNQQYGLADSMVEITRQNDSTYQELFVLAQPIPLDPSVRYQLLEKLNRLRGRIEFMSLVAGQMIDHIVAVGMQVKPSAAKRETERWGTFRFCNANRLPLRSLAEAMTPVPN